MTEIIKAPTREVELPISKLKVVFKEWLTKAESEKIKEPLRESNLVEVVDGKSTQRFNAKILHEVEMRTIEAAVVSIDGAGEGIKEMCLALPERDFDFLKEKIDEAISPPKEKKA